MQIKELCRKKKQTGEVVAEFEAGKIIVRLIDTYNSEKSFEELLYIIACRKLNERTDKINRQHCVKTI